jgi:predicted DNA-binding transcriptional regulator YafY
LMLLQTRGQVTAAEVAEELEVSERTARRAKQSGNKCRYAGEKPPTRRLSGRNTAFGSRPGLWVPKNL